MSAHSAEKLPTPLALRQAAAWLVRLHDEACSDADRQRWQRWLSESENNALAWRRAEKLTALIGDVPATIGAKPLLNTQGKNLSRRAALASVVGLLVGAPTAWMALKRQPWQHLASDYDTAIGEQRQVLLSDGTHLHLNTDTRLAKHFDDRLRLLRLLRGEVAVETGHDPLPTSRPLVVETRHGRMRALGTRFVVRLFDHFSQLAVQSGAVELRPARSTAVFRINAGEQVRFDASQKRPTTPLRPESAAWTQGVLQAEALPLGELIAELARYRPGVLRCDPAIAALPVSGVFQLPDTDKALHLLTRTFPLRLRQRSRYWVSVEPS